MCIVKLQLEKLNFVSRRTKVEKRWNGSRFHRSHQRVECLLYLVRDEFLILHRSHRLMSSYTGRGKREVGGWEWMMTIMNLITKERRVVYERKRMRKEHIHKKRKTSERNSISGGWKAGWDASVLLALVSLLFLFSIKRWWSSGKRAKRKRSWKDLSPRLRRKLLQQEVC